MEIELINNNIGQEDIDNILRVWESSVRATHDFLTEENIIAIKPQVKEAINYVDRLLCIRNEEGLIEAFMGENEAKIEMLFVSDNCRGRGMGKMLMNHAINQLGVRYVDVNEDNLEALAFYQYMGFQVFKRSELDENGDPFPILSMLLK